MKAFMAWLRNLLDRLFGRREPAKIGRYFGYFDSGYFDVGYFS